MFVPTHIRHQVELVPRYGEDRGAKQLGLPSTSIGSPQEKYHLRQNGLNSGELYMYDPQGTFLRLNKKKNQFYSLYDWELFALKIVLQVLHSGSPSPHH